MSSFMACARAVPVYIAAAVRCRDARPTGSRRRAAAPLAVSTRARHDDGEATHSNMQQARLPRSHLLKMGLLGAALSPLAPISPHKATASPLLDENTTVAVFEQASRSAVFIGNYVPQKDGDQKLEGVGSGVIWDEAGYIVTNYHVVAKLATEKGTGKQTAKVGVKQADGSIQMFDARVAGLDNYHDLAVLKIDAPEGLLVPVKIGTSGDLKVGQSLYAIGNPFGLESTLTTGLVSGLDRKIPSPAGRDIAGCIQTDTAINAGNSGGPLLDSFGRLVGINTATFTRQGTGMSSGVNFALPVDLAYDLFPKMVNSYGKPT